MRAPWKMELLQIGAQKHRATNQCMDLSELSLQWRHLQYHLQLQYEKEAAMRQCQHD